MQRHRGHELSPTRAFRATQPVISDNATSTRRPPDPPRTQRNAGATGERELRAQHRVPRPTALRERVSSPCARLMSVPAVDVGNRRHREGSQGRGVRQAGCANGHGPIFHQQPQAPPPPPAEQVSRAPADPARRGGQTRRGEIVNSCCRIRPFNLGLPAQETDRGQRGRRRDHERGRDGPQERWGATQRRRRGNGYNSPSLLGSEQVPPSNNNARVRCSSACSPRRHRTATARYPKGSRVPRTRSVVAFLKRSTRWVANAGAPLRGGNMGGAYPSV